MKTIKIGLFGDGLWAQESLRRLFVESEIEISFVCVRFDYPDTLLLQLADRYRIPTFRMQNVNSEASLSLVSKYGADLYVSMSFNQIFKEDILKLPPFGIINCHAGKLPFYRGRNILNWALINGEEEFGITVHQVDSGIDTGDILVQKTFPINSNDDYGSLLKIAYKECGPLLVKAVTQIRLGTSNPIPQSQIHPIGTYFPRRIQGDEFINWNQTSENVHNFIRALAFPGPFAQSFLNKHAIKIINSELVDNAPIFKGIPGSVIGVQGKILQIKTSDSFILIKDFESSIRPRLGDRFK